METLNSECGIENAALANILAITAAFYEIAKAKVISGQEVSRKDIASLNAARKEIAAARSALAE
ncbi:hypothetical protein [Burkholderia cenocepacia]|uniref:hypothetical protein n=1 Tax=Burkholderia cenocepacia TaxID=95486 RepID=UPI00264ACE7C|nr:hypothetical protein [Burkholderia cenocepacia]MDN7537030.1 hypothetical protein [Burkholderia cenocepacia]